MPPGLRPAAPCLPGRSELAYTGADDPVEYYYRPHTAWMYRARLRLALAALGSGPYDSLLEVGYGSGILLPELHGRARLLTGIDVHPHPDAVSSSMRRLGVAVDLRQASLFDIPFAAHTFDALVCLSVLEHVTGLDRAFAEFERVLAPAGVMVIGFPVRNPVTDGLFRILGYRPREIHPSSHSDIIRAAHGRRQVRMERLAQIPPRLPRALAAYVVMRARIADGAEE